MSKYLSFELLKNFVAYSVIAFIIAFFVSANNLPNISDEAIDEQGFVQMLSNKDTKITKILKSEKDEYYLNIKNEEEVVKVTEVSDQERFESMVKMNDIELVQLQMSLNHTEVAALTIQTFLVLLMAVIVFLIIDFRDIYNKYNVENLSFGQHFKKNFGSLYYQRMNEKLSNNTNPFKNKFFLLAFVVIFSMNLMQVQSSNVSGSQPNEYIYSQLIKDVKSKEISYLDIEIEDGVSTLKVVDKDNNVNYLTTGDTSSLKTLLDQYNVKYNEKNLGQSYDFTSIIITIVVLVVVIAVLSGIARGMQSKNPLFKGKDFNVVEKKPNVTLDDVKGIEDIKEEVSEVIDLLNNKVGTNSLGGKTPKGILIDGAPGVGKTLLAKAISNATDYHFIYTNGSEFAGQLQGQGAENITNLFETARKNQPAIIFIDEIDGVGQKRGTDRNGADSERTLNKLLVELDGFDTKEDNILIIGATNFPEKLDPALIRDGRFDREITIPLPKYKGRLELLEYFIGKVKASKDIDLNFLAHHTSGFSGAKLENLVNEAALLAARKQKEIIELEDLEEAQAKLVMGHKLPIEMSEKERWMTAYHEAGHAIVSKKSETQHKDVHKVSIIPRGRALGVTVYVPEEETYSVSKKELEADIASLYGGRIAEALLVGDGDVSTGASNDFSEATKLAERMVKHFGLSSKNLLTLGYKDSNQTGALSEEDKQTMEKILRKQYEEAVSILSNSKEDLKRMAAALIYYDTIEKDQIDRIMEGEDITEVTDNEGNVTRQEVPKEFDIELKDYKVSLTNETKEEKES